MKASIRGLRQLLFLMIDYLCGKDFDEILISMTHSTLVFSNDDKTILIVAALKFTFSP